MKRRSVDERLRASKPADPAGQELRAAAVRVLARLAMLEAGVRAAETGGEVRERRRLRPALAAAAGLAVLLLASSTREVASPPRMPAATTDGAAAVPADPWREPIEAALAGDVLARRRLLRAGGEARAALIEHALRAPVDADGALALLRAAGGVRDQVEAARVGALVARQDTRAVAVDLLATAPTLAGVEQLGRLLLEVPDAEAEVVAGLVRAARRGRRSTVLAALVRGSARGRAAAAAAALRIGTGRAAIDALEALPLRLLDDPRLAAACREAPATTRGSILRRAADGDERLLRVACRAHLPGIVPVLADRASSADEAVAREAVEALGGQEGAEAWVALARALGGSAADEARHLLGQAPEEAVAHLHHVAAGEPRRRSVALAGLGAAGEAGIASLLRLARRPALFAPVVAVLERTEGEEAVDALAELATGGRDRHRALVALANRLELGDRAAGLALLALADPGGSRQALRLLARHGAAHDARWLARLAASRTLRPATRSALERAARRAEGGGDGPPTTATRRRTPGAAPIT